MDEGRPLALDRNAQIPYLLAKTMI